MNEITYDFLKKNCKFIHAFGLGFIQIKLNDTERVHIYTPKVKTTTHPEEVHDHRYAFESKIIKGSLTNKIYQVVEGDKFYLTEENCTPNKTVSESPKCISCNVKLICSTTMEKGTVYFMDKDTLHRVETDRCITFLTRKSIQKDTAKVIFPKEVSLTCPFSVNKSEDDLWKIVKEEIEDAY